VTLLEWSAITKAITKIYKPDDPSDWTGLNWYGNRTTVPTDYPVCGWDGELCDSKETNNISLTVLSSIITVCVLVAIIVMAIFVRKRIYENALKDVGGVTVRWKDIHYMNREGKQSSTLHIKSDINTGKNSTQTLGIFQGKAIYIDKLSSETINLNDRQVLIDLKVMKDLAHANINTFVGICTQAPNTCILMEHEVRGSLWDLIEDAEVSLTMDFKVSLMLDVACGM